MQRHLVNGYASPEPQSSPEKTLLPHCSVSIYHGDWSSIRASWTDLLARSPSASAFQSWEWQSIWWRHFGSNHKRCILLAHDPDGRVIGIAPLKIRRTFGLRVLEWIGVGSRICPDHLDFILPATESSAVRNALLRYCFEELRTEWDLLNLTDIPVAICMHSDHIPVPPSRLAQPTRSSTIDDVVHLATAGGRQLWRRPGEVCPFSLLVGSYDVDFLRRRKKKFRLNARNYRRKMNKDYCVSITCCESSSQLDGYLDDLAMLHLRARRAKSQHSRFTETDYRSFHHSVAATMLEMKTLVLMRLSVDTTPIVVMMGYLSGRTCYFTSVGYDPAIMTGYLVAIGYLVEELMMRGVEILDWLRGDHEYKRRWSDGVTLTEHIAVSGGSLRGNLALPVLRYGHHLRKSIRSFGSLRLSHQFSDVGDFRNHK